LTKTSNKPEVAVGVVVLSTDGHVLLVKRSKPPRADEWSIPGGRQHWGETVAECAVREVKEETGLDARLIGLVDVVDGIFHDTDGALSHHYTLVDFVARASGEPRSGDDAGDARWVPLNAIGRYRLWSETQRVIEMAVDHCARTE
jgi:8-oxo-dGTP diphosphatase